MSPQYENSYEIERNKIIQKLIKDFGNGEGKNALDIGCYRGFYSEFLLKCGYKTTGVDINHDEIKLAYKRCLQYKDAVFKIVDLEKYDFKDLGSQFDLVLCLELIEHLNGYEELIQRIIEVMADKGKLVISTPNLFSFEGLRGKTMEFLNGVRFDGWDPTHKKIFNSFEFIRTLTNSNKLRILKTIGYWYSSNKLNKLQFRLRLPIKFTSMPVLNMFGWNTIVVAEKI